MNSLFLGAVNWYVSGAFIAYLVLMIGFGFFFAGKTNSLDDYYLGGRKMNKWVVALSAQASDMSGWLLMGLPGAIYVAGFSEAWIGIGLGIGTYLNWKIVAHRLRRPDSFPAPSSFRSCSACRIPRHCGLVRLWSFPTRC